MYRFRQVAGGRYVVSIGNHEEVVGALAKFCEEMGIPTKKITPEAIDYLKNCNWTGNIRELRNVVERLIILCDSTITKEDVETYR